MNRLLASSTTALLLGCWSVGFAQSPDVLRMQAFAQGAAKNCISVALIKAAIHRFGVGQVFDTLRTGSQVRITLRDSTTFDLTDEERQQAAEWASFKQPPGVALPLAERAAIVSYANLCYAVMAKYLQVKRLYKCTSNKGEAYFSPALGGRYQKALRKLTNKSICSDNAYRHLGLQVRDATAPAYNPASTYPVAVVYSQEHAVLVLGRQYDDHGTWTPLAESAQVDDSAFTPLWVFELK